MSVINIHNYDETPDNLKPCPFCGQAPEWHVVGNPDNVGKKRTIIIHCPCCGTEQKTSVLRLTTEHGCYEAINKWNKRIVKEAER